MAQTRPHLVTVDDFLGRFRPHCGKPDELLLSRELLEALPRLYAQDGKDDPIVYVKLFDPSSGWTWYITEGEVVRDDVGGVLGVDLFAWVVGLDSEWGYLSLADIGSIRSRFGLPIERDFSWQPTPMSKIRSGEVR